MNNYRQDKGKKLASEAWFEQEMRKANAQKLSEYLKSKGK